MENTSIHATRAWGQMYLTSVVSNNGVNGFGTIDYVVMCWCLIRLLLYRWVDDDVRMMRGTLMVSKVIAF